MARPRSTHPTELELEILKTLWEGGLMGVREVRDALAAQRDLAYTSVQTTMGIMVKKGYLRRRRQGRRFVFEPAAQREETARGMLGDVMDRVFDGSARALVLNLLEHEQVEDEELRALKRLIDRKVKEEQRRDPQ